MLASQFAIKPFESDKMSAFVLFYSIFLRAHQEDTKVWSFIISRKIVSLDVDVVKLFVIISSNNIAPGGLHIIIIIIIIIMMMIIRMVILFYNIICIINNYKNK